MTKKELILAMTDVTGITLKDTNDTFDAFIKTIAGFGTFQSKHRPQREGRNPSTGETITIVASNAPSFKAGKTFKDALN